MAGAAPLKHWTARVHALVEQASGPEIAAELRREWEQGLHGLLTDGQTVAVVEALAQPENALFIHAISGRNGLNMTRYVFDLAKAKGYSRVEVRARSESRARLFGRWCRQLKREGRLNEWAVQVANRAQARRTSAKTLFSQIPVVANL